MQVQARLRIKTENRNEWRAMKAAEERAMKAAEERALKSAEKKETDQQSKEAKSWGRKSRLGIKNLLFLMTKLLIPNFWLKYTTQYIWCESLFLGF